MSAPRRVLNSEDYRILKKHFEEGWSLDLVRHKLRIGASTLRRLREQDEEFQAFLRIHYKQMRPRASNSV